MLILKNYFIDFFNNKNKCRFKYIPEQLKTKKRPIVEKFEISELLFYRCDPQKLEKPYDNINLKDISHNRNFCDNNLYGHENVFFNIDASKISLPDAFVLVVIIVAVYVLHARQIAAEHAGQ